MSDQEELDTLDLDENGCAPDCPIRILGEQSGERKSGVHSDKELNRKAHGMFAGGIATPDNWYGDTGSAARYFAQFYPSSDSDEDNEEIPQERGETVMQDEVASGDLPIDRVIHGDALAVLKTLPSNSVHAIVTDPPYGMGTVKDIAGLLLAWIHDEDDSKHLGKSGFMGKEWDAGVPGPRYWREALRVLKPGGHLLAFSSTRTYDLLVIALRLAGFDIKEQVDWVFGSGFPKSHNVHKAVEAEIIKQLQLQGVEFTGWEDE